MRKGIDTKLAVVSGDASTGDQFLTRSTATSTVTITWNDGRTTC